MVFVAIICCLKANVAARNASVRLSSLAFDGFEKYFSGCKSVFMWEQNLSTIPLKALILTTLHIPLLACFVIPK